MKIKFQPKGLKESKFYEWLIRFGFGGSVSVLASLITQHWGPEIGGLFLAFPSILPATLTLIVHHRTRKEAADDAFGASLGGIALVAFALSVCFTLQSLGAVAALSLAILLWAILAIGIWYLHEW